MPALAQEEGGRDAHAPLLTRLVALNHERAAEEKRGRIRWLRPDFQNCSGGLRPSLTTSGGEAAASTEHAASLAPGNGILATIKALGHIA